MRTPESYHLTVHGGDFFSCRSCIKAQRDCQSKLQFLKPNDAMTYIMLGPFKSVRYWYGCKWCREIHIGTARSEGQKEIAAEQRRKWLAAQRSD